MLYVHVLGRVCVHVCTYLMCHLKLSTAVSKNIYNGMKIPKLIIIFKFYLKQTVLLKNSE